MISMLLLLVFFIIIAMLWNEGCWSNILTLINVLLAALIATNYFEPMADWVEGFSDGMHSYTYLWDFLSLWGLFFLTYGILRTVTDQLSKTRVRFKMPVEHVGRVFFAGWAALVFISFLSMSLHLAPLAAVPLRGSFHEKPDDGVFFGLALDRNWLGLMQSRSRGALSHKGGSDASNNEDDNERLVFDPKSEFIFKYHSRRETLEQYNNRTGRIRIEP